MNQGDEQLLKLIAEGDPNALGILFSKHLPKLKGLVRLELGRYWVNSRIAFAISSALCQHSFRLPDKESGRVLDKTIKIHTLELGKYNLAEADLATASMRDRWLYLQELTSKLQNRARNRA